MLGQEVPLGNHCNQLCEGLTSGSIIPPGLDISADLTALGRTPIAVVSAGVKSILDIGRTLEFLVRVFR